MRIKCPYCGEVIETAQEVVIGQHVVCPVCNRKFSYGEEMEWHSTKKMERPQGEDSKVKEAVNEAVEDQLDAVIKKLNEICETCRQKEKGHGWKTFVAVLAALIVFSLLSNVPGCRVNVNTEFTNGGVKTHYNYY